MADESNFQYPVGVDKYTSEIWNQRCLIERKGDMLMENFDASCVPELSVKWLPPVLLAFSAYTYCCTIVYLHYVVVLLRKLNPVCFMVSVSNIF